jgi:NhaP-type Na+/H+ or K+/H+ antiporter
MRKKKFFANLGNVALFGLVVTLVCFVIYSAMAYIVINHFGLMMTNYYDINYHDSEYTSTNPNASASNAGTPIVVLVQNPMPIVVPTMQILLLCALLCSSDVVSAVSIVDYKQQPKLYSCIFGEGVFNDIVSIILFNTVEQLQSVQF